MLHILPNTDLKEDFEKIENLVERQGETIYLTKNGYGSMVVLSLEKYAEMLKSLDKEKALEARFGVIDIDKALEEAEEEANNPNTTCHSHEEMKQMARRIIDGK